MTDKSRYERLVNCASCECAVFYFHEVSPLRLCVQSHSRRQFRSVPLMDDEQDVHLCENRHYGRIRLSVHGVNFACVADCTIMWRDPCGCLLTVYSSLTHLKLLHGDFSPSFSTDSFFEILDLADLLQTIR